MSVKTSGVSNPVFVGETVRLTQDQVTDDFGAMITSPVTASVDVVDPNGNVVATYTLISSTPIVNAGGGSYYVEHKLGDSDPVGVWEARWTFTTALSTGKFVVPFIVSAFTLAPP